MSRYLHLNPPFRAEHVGSLLRPAKLVQKRFDHDAQKCTAKSATRRRGQEHFGSCMFEKLEGMSIIPNLCEATKSDGPGKIQRKRGIHTEDLIFLKGLVAPEEVKHLKITICGPTWMHSRHGSEYTYDQAVYKSDESDHSGRADDYFADLIRAYREELTELYDLGCRHIQFDEPTFAFFCSESVIAGMEHAGVDHEALLDQYISVYNAILQEQPADLTLSLHTCRGNYKGIHFSEGGFDRIAVKFFNDLNINCYYLEYDSERAGSLEPLQYLPLHKTVVLGLVTSKSAQMENLGDIRERVEKAVDSISQGNPKRSREDALNQVCISPQCGFASVFEGKPLSEEDERRKLGLVVEAAKQIWGPHTGSPQAPGQALEKH
ncbi:predicted protein [Postia placenta Mad-698-R]|nr:predicted protein [Postia placenta Mad-698-R]